MSQKSEESISLKSSKTSAGNSSSKRIRTMTDKAFESFAAQQLKLLTSYRRLLVKGRKELKNLSSLENPKTVIISSLGELKQIRDSLREVLTVFKKECSKKDKWLDLYDDEIQDYTLLLADTAAALKAEEAALGYSKYESVELLDNKYEKRSDVTSVKSVGHSKLYDEPKVDKLSGAHVSCKTDTDRSDSDCVLSLRSMKSSSKYNDNNCKGQNNCQPNQMFVDSMTLMAKIQLMNTIYPLKFDGDSFKYPLFREEVRLHLEDGILSDHYQKSFLRKFLEGSALNTVDQNMSLSYNELIKLLKNRFGNSVAITEAWIKRLTEGPHVNDVDGLRGLADHLGTANKVLNREALREMNSKLCIKKIVSRLPSKYLAGWIQWIDKKGGRETIVDLADFINSLIKTHNHPVYNFESIYAPQANRSNSGYRSNSQKNNTHSFSRPTEIKGMIIKTEGKCDNGASSENKFVKYDKVTQHACTFCKVSKPAHSLETCEKFMAESIEVRHAFVKDNLLCFGCLADTHRSKGCVKRSICKICSRKHPTCLHSETVIYVTKSAKEIKKEVEKGHTSARCAASSPGVDLQDSKDSLVLDSERNAARANFSTTSFIIPVLLYKKSNPIKKIKTYAILDNGSDSCFIKDSLVEELNLPFTSIKLQLRTLSDKTYIDCLKVREVIVEGLNTGETIELPAKSFSRSEIPGDFEDIPGPETAKKNDHLKHLADKMFPVDKHLEIGLLIGNNCPRALCPLEVIKGNDNEAYGVRSHLGWGIIGPKVDKCIGSMAISCRIDTRIVSGDILTKEILNPWSTIDFPECNFSTIAKGHSIEDQKFLEILNKNIKHRQDMHYELPLPFKDKQINLSNNKVIALKRLQHLKIRFEKNSNYKSDYVSFINNMILQKQAEPVPDVPVREGGIWYIPHHGVYHPKKPGKIRVVFDCSASFKGNSLNSNLLSGPDLTNNLIGVLIRFREERIAFAGDIEGMFHQVYMEESCRNYLRFLWWENGDTTVPAKEFRMTVHLFGASSSPGCSNFALKQSAIDNPEVGENAVKFVLNSFYVDDGCDSVENEADAVDVIMGVREICRRGGFRFHKIISNCESVLSSVPQSERSTKGIAKLLDPKYSHISSESILGLTWETMADSFSLSLANLDRRPTRRGILSSVSSVYDPLGFFAPYILQGKAILQDLNREIKYSKIQVEWDEEVRQEVQVKWRKWITGLTKISSLSVDRCYKSCKLSKIISVQLHHFSDASSVGYGQVTYIRFVDEFGKIHCSFVIGKSRVHPLKEITIPRLELTAALVSARMSRFLDQELRYKNIKHFFWTDSKPVLGYIYNESRRFHIFVANRVQEIRDLTNYQQWKYINTKENPADIASRVITAEAFVLSDWLRGPQFLWKNEGEWNDEIKTYHVNESDPEVKAEKSIGLAARLLFPSLLDRLERFSKWTKARRAVAVCIRYLQILNCLREGKDVKHLKLDNKTITVEEMKQSETSILKALQKQNYSTEIKAVSTSETISKRSNLLSLNPVVAVDGLLRVGGRLRNLDLEDQQRHPVILPKNEHVSRLIAQWCHEKMRHQGRSITMNCIRSSGYWLIGNSSVVRRLIAGCVICQRMRGKFQEQKMADLPLERLRCSTPFAYSAVDCFGPYYIRIGRRQEKRYGIIFTCMSSRAVSLDVLDSMTTDSVINAIRRLLCRRGPIKHLRSDLGTNFVGANKELMKQIREINFPDITKYLVENCCTFDWTFNPPKASHMNGAVERLIGVVRRVMEVILITHPRLLSEDSLRTFFSECECIVNGRPLTIDNLCDPDSLEPLTPNHAILINPQPLLPPPGDFNDVGLYLRRRWRQVQHLANQFWTRWRKEYITILQERKKWALPTRNLSVGDIVICRDDQVTRNKWPLARVTKTFPSDDGLTRCVEIQYGDRRTLLRPVVKLVLLVSQDGSIPIREPTYQNSTA